MAAMAKARIPGNKSSGINLKVKRGWERSEEGDSKRMCERSRDRDIISARWKSVLLGLRVAPVWRKSNRVSDQDKADAVITSRNRNQRNAGGAGRRQGIPCYTNWVSVATMRISPTVIVAIAAISFQPGFSK